MFQTSTLPGPSNWCPNCGKEFACSPQDVSKNAMYCPSCETAYAAYEAEQAAKKAAAKKETK